MAGYLQWLKKMKTGHICQYIVITLNYISIICLCLSALPNRYGARTLNSYCGTCVFCEQIHAYPTLHPQKNQCFATAQNSMHISRILHVNISRLYTILRQGNKCAKLSKARTSRYTPCFFMPLNRYGAGRFIHLCIKCFRCATIIRCRARLYASSYC